MLSNDDMIMKKIEQQAGHENFPSANSCLIPALDLVSPIGKIRQREPGPITSTPRDIVLSSNEKEPSAKLSSANNISNSSGKDLHLIERVDRSRSILSAVASPLELEKKEKKHGQLMAKNFHEKRKIAWGYVGEAADALEIATLADDKVPDSPMQVSTAEHISNMDISTINSTNDKSNLIKENKKMNNCNLNDMFTTSDNSKVREMQEARPKNTSISISLEDEIINDGSCSSFLDEKENTPTSNEIESVNVSSSLSESSIYISNVNSPSEMSNNIEECALSSGILNRFRNYRDESSTKLFVQKNKEKQITANELAATSIHDASEDDCQIIDSFSLSHSASTLEFAQKIPSTLSRMELETQLNNLKNLKRSANLSKLPDFGRRLLEKLKILQKKFDSLDAFEKNENVIPNEFIENENVDIIQKKNGPPIISPQAIAGGRRLFGGKMTDNRIYLANAVTGQVIAQMHSSLANIPENVKTDTPTSLLTELMPHQKEGLTWLLWREKQSLPGGILADDMGLGKTLSMISLIVNVKERRMQNAMVIDGSNIKVTKDSYLIPSRATLIVAPASLIFQWEAEFQKHVKSDFLSRYLFYGPKHKRDISAKCLARYDVVITTYGIVSSELTEKFTAANVEDERKSNDTSDSVDGKNGKEKAKRKVSKKSGSALTKIAWERIILDEAHQIKNRTSLVSKACCKIPAATRWCLTGTPIHNNLWDLYSLIRFLRVAPFDEEAVWKEYILSAHSSSQRLNTLVKGLLLRREKNQLCTETNKPIVSRQQVKELIKTREERERDLYGIKRTNASNKPARNPFLGGSRTIRNNDNFQTMTCVLTLLMRLRQACVHFALINQAVDMEALQTLGIEEDENAELLSEHFSNMSLLDEKAFTTKLLLDNGNKQIEQLFQETFVSTKIKKLFEHVDHALSCGDKCVIVSQWTSLLNILEYHLKRKQISYTSISGKVSSSDRQKRANSFNKIDNGPRVMLLSLTAGGVGLNLVGGNHLFLIDLHWNPALEQQACDRIYRIGQTKNVYIHKLVCLETIEERVLALQQIKETLAKDVLQGVASKKLSKLTIADLKYLFDLGRPHDNLANFGGTICPPKFISASTTSDIDSGSLIANAVVEK
ncbi:unnamed protein product [Onchocerca ochengi]|uniref:Helicase ATP-binding domain-containing protein n=1 Tax=Onchocerca ochengi TaxID=42157 RepID=A0A182E8L3_ONCOC|nr:unnamed protein product [Onchocerca ochengi]